MSHRISAAAIVLVSALCASIVATRAWDDSKYPDLKGQWVRADGSRGVGRYDPTKPPGRLQEVPLTAEYQAIYEANLADKEAGGHGSDPTHKNLPARMPQIMHACTPVESVPMTDTTYILIGHIHHNPRIHTDGRAS